MQTELPRLAAEVATLLRQAAATDQAENHQDGARSRGDDLPAEVAYRAQRIARIRAAKAAVEAEAQAEDPGEPDVPRRGRPRATPPVSRARRRNATSGTRSRGL